MTDIGPLPPPQAHDAEWAWRLWNSLHIEGGIWDMPGVGRYRRTGPTELTLTEIHASMEPDRLGVNVWNKHDWVCLLAETVGWVVVGDQVEKADTQDAYDPEEPELEHIGKAFACPCGLVYSLHGVDAGFTRYSVGDDGYCLNTNCDIVLPYPHAGRLNVVDDTALLAKMEAQEQISIAVDEDEYPAPPDDPIDLSVEEEFHSQMKIAEMVDEEHPHLMSEEEAEWEGLTDEEKIAHLESYDVDWSDEDLRDNEFGARILNPDPPSEEEE
tara:strand:- start:1171 stop:1980 length:810 start_codon:yes stop_codon:yes gene_type:complete